jgi:two-component system sensor histidine kinase RegB
VAPKTVKRDLSTSSARVNSQESIQLWWLIKIRWASIVSLLVIFIGAAYVFDFPLAWERVAGILSLGVLSNLVLMARSATSEDPPHSLAGISLVIDVVVLTGLLYMSGGYANPFSMMFLVYVTLAAFFLNAAWTWGVLGISALCFTALFFFHVPLPQLGMRAHHIHHDHGEGMSLHLHGMFVAFLVIGVITAAFVTRMNREISEQAKLIVDLERAEDERRRLASLATLAAGAAHELSSPIGTLVLIGDDLARDLGDHSRWSDDVTLMRQELERCRAILRRMRGQSSELIGEAPSRCVVSDIVRDVSSQFEKLGLSSNVDPIVGATSLVTLRDGLSSTLHNLVRNAFQACARGESVHLSVALDSHEVAFSVIDSGVGMSEDTRRRAGEPFFTSKQPGEGMGLGLYLAKLFAAQVGGTLSIESKLGGGTRVDLRIPMVVAV